MNSDGSSPTNLTHNPALDVDPAWLPEGKGLLFTSNRDGDSAIYRMDIDGANVTRLASGSDAAWVAGWGIAFLYPGDFGTQIYLMTETGTLQQAWWDPDLYDASQGLPLWSMDGQRAVFYMYQHDNVDVYVANADGTAQQRLTYSDAIDGEPAWSPDGRRLAFASDRDGYSHLFLMQNDGSGLTRLTQADNYDHYPVWSPNGRQLAFVTDRDGNEEIYLLPLGGGEPINLTNHPANESQPAFQP